MFFLLKSLLIVVSFLFIHGCASKTPNSIKINYINSVSIETNKDRDNILFKENLKRLFKTRKNDDNNFILKALIRYKTLNIYATK